MLEKYNIESFQKDLEELKMICDELSIRGVKVVLTNNDTEFVRELFKDYNFKDKNYYIKVDKYLTLKENEYISFETLTLNSA